MNTPRPDDTAPAFEALADDAWLLTFGTAIDPAVNARVHALAARLREAPPPWLIDLVPAYASLGVFFDPRRAAADQALDWLLREATATEAPGSSGPIRTVEVPVAYGGELGPDLERAAGELGLTPAALVQRHVAGRYRVAMIGFSPGFPYLSGLDLALALPRLATPRTRVPAGSVAIGGAQTGIYPREGPGGWRLLGRTPLQLFDPQREPPAVLAPGDRVRLRAIDPDEFARLAETPWSTGQ
ncbi:MAG: 5-oxoprolinase subunit PxpB [Proteobacteria bacterium]|nr:5-oxoprolinase subunit PxpB [Pseudomonadota bacterium]